MRPRQPLSPEALYRACDPDKLPFETTRDVEDLTLIVGQDRAVEAVEFGIGMRRPGYNLFALGAPGTGRHSVVRQFLERAAGTEPTPPDLCYVPNFAQPHRPRALRLPPGLGVALRRDVDRLLEDLRKALPAAFESDEYRARRRTIDKSVGGRQERTLAEVRERSEVHSVTLVRTPLGMAFTPMHEGRPMSPEGFDELPEDERRKLETAMENLQEELHEQLEEITRLEREAHERLDQLDREVATTAVSHLVDALRERYKDLGPVVTHLDALQADVVEHFDDFLEVEEEEEDDGEEDRGEDELVRARRVERSLRRYSVNVLVDHSETKGAPVVFEDHPTYPNLLGRIEHQARLGALVTDFSLIKAGALHRATGGYLIVDANRLLVQSGAWEGLKRALRACEARIESMEESPSVATTMTLEPEPIPLDVKVMLIGDRALYDLLDELDSEFEKLFKVVADFDDDMPRTPEGEGHYAKWIATVARREKLRPFDRGAVARVVEHGARVADHAGRLSTRFGAVADLLRESDYWAGRAGRETVAREDVQRALDAQTRRVDRLRERLHGEIREGTVKVETGGERVGQVNALTVVGWGRFAFGYPTRVTATVRLGRGDIIDIEREIELGGPLHSKGVLILSGYLASRYAAEHPLSLWSSLVFEQSYGEVEGDSASSAELYALLSAIAEVPLRQSFAVTGAVDQFGNVQAIGGVNEKIEGFFDVCATRGLTGDQGVLIPVANVRNLMLRREVTEAVAAGRFRIHPVATVDEGLELLTGLPAGERDTTGALPQGSVNQRVEARLLTLAERRRTYGVAT